MGKNLDGARCISASHCWSMQSLSVESVQKCEPEQNYLVEPLQRFAIELKTEYTQDTDSPVQQSLGCVHTWWVGTGTKFCCVKHQVL